MLEPLPPKECAERMVKNYGRDQAARRATDHWYANVGRNEHAATYWWTVIRDIKETQQ